MDSLTEGDCPCSLKEIGNGEKLLFEGDARSADDPPYGSDSISPKLRQSHCSFCGHPGSKRDHFKSSCANCITGDGAGCLKKPDRFKCDCFSCNRVKHIYQFLHPP